MSHCPQCSRELPPGSPEGSRCADCATRGEVAPLTSASVPPYQRVGGHHLGPQWSLAAVLVGANVIVFLAMLANGGHLMRPAPEVLLRWGANFGPLTLDGQWWRLLSNTFLHAGILHLGFNMWALWNLGQLGETLYSRRTLLLIYVLSGLAGSLTSLWWRPIAVSVGASGAIFGLAGALIASLYLGKLPFHPQALKSTTGSLVTFAGYSLLLGAISPQIDNAAHVGGLLAGLVMGASIGHFILARRAHRPLLLRAIFAAMLVLLLAGATYVNRRHGYIPHLERAGKAMKSQQWEVAIRELQIITRAVPENASAWHTLGQALQHRQPDDPQAEAAFRRALQADPRYVPAHLELGKIQLMHKKNEEALANFQEVLKYAPNNVDALANSSLSLSRMDRHQEAIVPLEKALQQSPGVPLLRFMMAQEKSAVGDHDGAIAEMRKLLASDPDNGAALLVLAALYEQKGMRPQAAELRRRVAELQRQAEQAAPQEAPADAPPAEKPGAPPAEKR